MTSYSTALPTPRVRKIGRQDMIAQSLPPHTTNKPTPTSIRSDNLGPLTTTFIPPPHCSRVALRCPTCTDARRGQFCRTQLNGQKAEDDPTCWPTGMAVHSQEFQAPRGARGVYSPGLICPTGYVTACARSPTQTDQPDFQFPLEAQETGIGCCPTGYGCDRSGGLQTCTQVVTSTVIDAMTCSGSNATPLDAFQIPFVRDARTITEMKLYAPMIQLVHQSTDVFTQTTDDSSLSATSTSSPQKPSSTVPSQTKEALFFDKSNKLSKTEISGIVIACVIFFLCILSIICYCVIRKKRPHLIPVIFSPSSSDSKEKSRDLQYSPTSSTAHLNITPPMMGPKVHSLSAYTTPIDRSSPNDSRQQHLSTSQLGFPPNSPYAPMAPHDGNSLRAFDTAAPRFSSSLVVDDNIESPIDGTSPFRLKRGNTVKGSKLDRLRSTFRHKQSTSERCVSPISPVINDMEEWDAIIGEGSLDRHVSAVSEPRIRQTGLRTPGMQTVPQNVAVGSVSAHVPEMQRTVGDTGTWKSHRAKVSVAGPGAPGPGFAL